MNGVEWIGSYFYKDSYRGFKTVWATNLVQARERVKELALRSWAFGPEHMTMSAVVPICLPGASVNYKYWGRENCKLDPVLAAQYAKDEREAREFQAMLDARWDCHTCEDIGWTGDVACPSCGLHGWIERTLWWFPPGTLTA
jgi:hypothetical protein